MAGEEHEPYDNPKLKGINRYFNGQTIRGRANVAKLTLAGIFGFILYKTVIRHHLPGMPNRKCPAGSEDVAGAEE